MADPKDRGTKARMPERGVEQLLDMSENGRASVEQQVSRVSSFVEESSDRAQQAIEQVASATNDLAGRSGDALQGTFDTSNVMARGLREAMQMWGEFAQDSWRQQVQLSQDLLRCRSLPEVWKLQADFARGNFERFVDRTQRTSKLSAAVALSTAITTDELGGSK